MHFNIFEIILLLLFLFLHWIAEILKPCLKHWKNIKTFFKKIKKKTHTFFFFFLPKTSFIQSWLMLIFISVFFPLYFLQTALEIRCKGKKIIFLKIKSIFPPPSNKILDRYQEFYVSKTIKLLLTNIIYIFTF